MLLCLCIGCITTQATAQQSEHVEQTTLPLEFRLDRNYYTSEKVARVRCRRQDSTGLLHIKLTLSGPDSAQPVLPPIQSNLPAGTDSQHVWEFDLSSCEMGTYTLQVNVRDEQGTVGSDYEMVLEKHPPARHEVKYDWNNSILVDGKLFYPIGYFGGSICEQTVASASRQGYNCLIEWPAPGVFGDDDWPTARLMAAAQKHNMLVIAYGPFERHGNKWDQQRSPAQRFQRAIAGVSKLKRHPALLGYMTVDEPHYSPEKHQELQRTYQAVHQRDPYHPVIVNHWWTGPDPKFTGVSDWVGKDIYPVANGCFTQLEHYWQLVAQMTHNRKPFVWVTQAYASPVSRMPSQLELRHMTYLMIIRGAKSVMFYTYKPWPFFIRYNGDLVAELNQIAPILLADYPQMINRIRAQRIRDGSAKPATMVIPLAHKYPDDWPPIAAAVWRKPPHGVYVIATNRQTYPMRATFQLPKAGDGQVRVINENRTLPLRHGRWSDKFGPIGVHIYELVSE